MFYEPLESRRHFSVSLDTSGNLVHTGTDGADVVSLRNTKYPTGTRLQVTENGVTTYFPLSSVRHIYLRGLGGDDQITVASNVYTPATIYGGDGDDRLTGGSGPGTVSGGAGNDTVDGGLGADALYGGSGRDIVTYAARTASVFLILDGIRNDGQAGENDYVYTDFEEYRGGRGNDRLYGNHLANHLDGGAGNDVIEGYGGDDILLGGPGDDFVYAGNGNDYVKGGEGNDHLRGELGDDRVWGGYGNDFVTGGDGNDWIYGDHSQWNGGPYYETYVEYYSPLEERTYDDRLYGDGGDDQIHDTEGDNWLYGGAGNDHFFNSEWDLYSGVNYVDGGAGYDTALEEPRSAFLVSIEGLI